MPRDAERQRSIPCVLIRAGTSKGPFFHKADLPTDKAMLDAVLLSVMGSPDVRQIDGIGGATTVTSKVAIVSSSEHPDADIDYLFAQVDIERQLVDWEPTCGNMLSGVGPFAIEQGLFAATPGTTSLTVRNVNTESFIDVVVQTPGGEVTYEGSCSIHGVPGTSAPIELHFREITGSQTGALFPTGSRIDLLDGIEATCIDVAMPLVLVRAVDLGLSGYESTTELDNNNSVLARIHDIRLVAGKAMGLDDVSDKVIPKFAVVAPSTNGGHFASRYFTPSQCHPAYAVSGSIAAASAAIIDGTIAHEATNHDARMPDVVEIEHPSGSIVVGLQSETDGTEVRILSGGAVRTARTLLKGSVYVPSSTWP
ncbi:MAG: 4-oxalomesaconate tautomerase [Acidimicrobiales bacterium]|nr:4-oxalomesaconate tautomerase [Acidimicrobiales bacterium]RZV46998.1 MAG: 4-oxalomesaconate tautomerase [Acidimicrobiales bacterium]